MSNPAATLAFRQVDDAYGPLQTTRFQRIRQFLITQQQQETIHACLMEELLVAAARPGRPRFRSAEPCPQQGRCCLAFYEDERARVYDDSVADLLRGRVLLSLAFGEEARSRAGSGALVGSSSLWEGARIAFATI